MRKVLLLTSLLLAGCDTTPERKAQASNAAVKVSVLTTFEGITLYRVEADGKQIYVAKAGTVPVSTTAHWTETESCGKNCTRQVAKQLATIVPQEER